MLTTKDAFLKRSFDLTMSLVGLFLTGWIILIAWIIASIETRSNGMFVQERIGKNGKHFKIYKIRSMHVNSAGNRNHQTSESEKWSSVTTSDDARTTRLGRFWRRTKIDELPQLFNVLLGQMSFVGPRPDVPGFADNLTGKAKDILTLRPGITGPASLKYRDEEKILSEVADPIAYNRDVIYPDKVAINLEYLGTWSFSKDISYIIKTILGSSAH